MTPEEKDLLKLRLRNHCIEQLRGRLDVTEQLITRAQDAANSEGKSSAGDKYETARSMSQLEKQMYQKQAQQLRNELSVVTAIDLSRSGGVVARGSLVYTGKVMIFVCAGLGKQLVDSATVLFISQDAPLFRLIAGKTIGDQFMLSRQLLIITEIW